MAAYLCTGANDDHLYRVLKMCVKMCLPISICENAAFISKRNFSEKLVYSVSLISLCSLFDGQMSWRDLRGPTNLLIDIT